MSGLCLAVLLASGKFLATATDQHLAYSPAVNFLCQLISSPQLNQALYYTASIAHIHLCKSSLHVLSTQQS